MITRSTTRRPIRGFTLVELLLAMALLAVMTIKVSTVMTGATRSSNEATRRAVLEDQARGVLQKIAIVVMGANRESLIPDTPAPLSMSDLRFQVNLGIVDGSVVWSDPEKVALDEVERKVYWSTNPDAEAERRMTWSNLAAPFLEGELPNGMDDNGNGLIDEKGLSFEVDRNAVCIRLTLERTDDDGQTVTETVETTVTCRNLTANP